MEKLLLEINRYKQLMNIVLLTEGGKVVDEILPISARSVDNLTKQGVDFANDLSKLSDEFTNQGIKTFDGLTRAVAVKNGLNPNMNLSYLNITDDMIKAYIKNDEKLYNSILAKAASAAAAGRRRRGGRDRLPAAAAAPARSQAAARRCPASTQGRGRPA